MNPRLHARIQESLAAKEAAALLRKPVTISDDYDGVIAVDGVHYLNFAGNDYLGLRQHQHVLQSYVEGLSKYGSGSGASPLVTGHSIEHERLCAWLAAQLGYGDVLLFSSGFAANHAICQALLNKDDVVVADKLMHASFIEGAVQSPATLLRFTHNDMSHAQQRLASAADKAVLLASEGVFSMDGDSADVPTLVQLANQQQTTLMLDDAHAIGVVGERGLGSVDANHLSMADCPLLLGTFGKGVGTGGAFVAGSRDMIAYLTNNAKHYIYSTAFSAANARATLAALELIVTGAERVQLHSNIALFKALAQARGLPVMPSDSAIQPIIVGAPESCLQAAHALRELGLWVGAIRSPTVPVGKDRLRITLSALHQDKDITALVDGLCVVRDKQSLWGA